MRWNENFNGRGKNIYIWAKAVKRRPSNTHIDNLSQMIYGPVNQQGAANTSLVPWLSPIDLTFDWYLYWAYRGYLTGGCVQVVGFYGINPLNEVRKLPLRLKRINFNKFPHVPPLISVNLPFFMLCHTTHSARYCHSAILQGPLHIGPPVHQWHTAKRARKYPRRQPICLHAQGALALARRFPLPLAACSMDHKFRNAT